MNNSPVLLLSALTLGLQVKIAGNVYLLENGKLFRLDFHTSLATGSLDLRSELVDIPLSLTDFINMSKKMTHEESINLHELLSHHGAITHD
jgi:hypothetical protein